MNYYKRHLGDYARKAGHLSMLEHGAYNLIMDAYYDRERSLTRKEAIRVSRARTEAEVEAVDTVFSEFFTEQNPVGFDSDALGSDSAECVYVQSRIEEESERLNRQSDNARRNGQGGGRPPKLLTRKTEAAQNPLGFGSFSNKTQSKATPLQHDSTTSTAPSDPARCRCHACLIGSLFGAQDRSLAKLAGFSAAP